MSKEMQIDIQSCDIPEPKEQKGYVKKVNKLISSLVLSYMSTDKKLEDINNCLSEKEDIVR